MMCSNNSWITLPHSRPFRVAVLLFAAFITLAAVASILTGRVVTPEELEESLAPRESDPVTVSVERQIVRSTLVGRGGIVFVGEVSVALPVLPGLDGALPIITGVPEALREIRAGDVLIEVAYRPVFALEGPRSLVRDLHQRDSGPDVEALQQALVGYGSLESQNVDGKFGPQTATALQELYEDAGYAPPKQNNAIYLPVAEVHIVNGLPLVVRRIAQQVGDVMSTTASFMVLSAQASRLVMALPSFEAELLSGGENAVILDDATGEVTEGVVVDVGIIVDPELGGVPVAVRFEGELPDDRDYRVTIEVETTDGPALAVPETALYLGIGDSSYVLRLDSGSIHRVPVETGIVGSDGFVEIIATDSQTLISEGDLVIVGGQP